MAKGQQRSNKEARKPKKTKTKTIAANASQKGGVRGLENLNSPCPGRWPVRLAHDGGVHHVALELAPDQRGAVAAHAD